jgi:hypothetical protein
MWVYKDEGLKLSCVRTKDSQSMLGLGLNSEALVASLWWKYMLEMHVREENLTNVSQI